MSDLERALDALLSTDARDPGCAETWRLIHAYCEAVLAGADPEERFPGVTAHLRSCPPCARDQEALITLVLDADG